MAIYAILGATGNCGSALIELLSKRSDAKIHAFCRNKAKLQRHFPGIDSNQQMRIFEGGLTDSAILKSCLTGCRAIFIVLSTNDNIPGCRLSRDIASRVIDALQELRQDGATMPKLVLLSSSTVDAKLSQEVPPLLLKVLHYSASNVYYDLVEAEKYLRAQESWLTTIYIKPGALSVDAQRGHGLSLDQADHRPLSYLDLAAGMIDAAEDEDGRYDRQNVGVVNLKTGAKFPAGTPLCIASGLLRHFFPFMHSYLPTTGPG